MSLGLDLPGHGSGRAAELPRLRVLELCEQLIVEAMPVLDKIPRCHRYRYGARLESALFALPELVVQAASSGAKTKVFALTDHLEVTNALLRIGAERKLISPRFVGHIMSAPTAAAPRGASRWWPFLPQPTTRPPPISSSARGMRGWPRVPTSRRRGRAESGWWLPPLTLQPLMRHAQ